MVAVEPRADGAVDAGNVVVDFYEASQLASDSASIKRDPKLLQVGRESNTRPQYRRSITAAREVDVQRLYPDGPWRQDA